MRTYVFPGIVETGEGGGYGLFFPDLPGCVTAADDLPSLAAHAREALQLHLEGMTEVGLHIPEPSSIEGLPHDPDVHEVGVLLVEASLDGSPQGVTVQLPSGLVDRINEAARARDVTFSDVIAESAEASLKAS